jgi:hypothetical protein
MELIMAKVPGEDFFVSLPSPFGIGAGSEGFLLALARFFSDFSKNYSTLRCVPSIIKATSMDNFRSSTSMHAFVRSRDLREKIIPPRFRAGKVLFVSNLY